MAMIKNKGPGEMLERELQWYKQNNEKKNDDLKQRARIKSGELSQSLGRKRTKKDRVSK